MIDSFTSKDFYFATLIDFDDLTIVGVVLKDYFDKFETFPSESLDLDQILPHYLDTELVEGIYESEVDVEKAHQDMLRLGFEENEKFLKLLITYYH